MIDNKLNEAQEHLQLANRILSEEYGIGPAPVRDEVPQQPFSEPQQGIPQEQNIARQDNRINKIREVALQGLQDYAHNVDSEQYNFYKKIWLMCDKAVSEKDIVGEANNT